MSKKQPVTSLSSTEAEYYAASSCGQDILFLRHLLRDIGYEEKKPTPLKIDNSACVTLGEHFESAKRVRHIDRRVNFLTDYQDMGVLKVKLVSTHLNTADMFTKPLPKDKFLKFREHALGLSSSAKVNAITANSIDITDDGLDYASTLTSKNETKWNFDIKSSKSVTWAFMTDGAKEFDDYNAQPTRDTKPRHKPRMVGQGDMHSSLSGVLVNALRRPIYGFKDAAKNWN